AAESLSAEELDAAAAALLDSYDPAWGGFGPAPKFPPMMNILQLLAAFVRLGGTAEEDGGGSVGDEDRGRAASASAAEADDHPVSMDRSERLLAWLGSDALLTG